MKLSGADKIVSKSPKALQISLAAFCASAMGRGIGESIYDGKYPSLKSWTFYDVLLGKLCKISF